MRRRSTEHELTEWRSRLIAAYPRLFPDAHLVQDEAGDRLHSAGWPCVGDGWRDIVERLCGRLDAVAARARGSLSIIEIDEKHGAMRVSIATLSLTAAQNDRADLAVQLAEARSEHVCDICGDRGRIVEHGGWLQARCHLHRDGAPDLDPDIRAVGGRKTGKGVEARLYDFDSDTFKQPLRKGYSDAPT